MADVFVSYASPDRERVLPIVRALEHRGWSVWWDRELLPGDTWPAAIERQLERARCVVVCWSKHSIESSWVRLEANRARQRANLLPVQLDETLPPPEFGAYQSIRVSDTPDDTPALTRICDGVAALLQRRRAKRLTWIGAACLGAVAIFATGACFVGGACRAPTETAPAPDETSLAVMLDTADARDPELSALAGALVDDVRRTLRRTAFGSIASRAETLGLPPEMSSIEIGRRLRVRWLLILSVSIAQQDLQVLAELIDTSSGFLADDWSLRAPLRRLDPLHADLVRRVLERFAPEGSALDFADDEPGEAYTPYLRGRAAMRDGSDPQSLASAEEIFEGILLRWPRHARAEASLCQIALMRYEVTRAPELLATGERHCANALALDPDTAEASLALGQLRFLAGRLDESRNAYLRASADPEVRADARIGLGRIDLAESRSADAEREFRAAVDDAPGYWRTHTELGNFLFTVGRGAEGVDAQRAAIALARHDGSALNNLGAALFVSGQMDAAIDAWRAALDLDEAAPAYSNLGAAYYLEGRDADAVEMYARSLALNADDYRTWSNYADALAAGRAPGAADAYERARTLVQREIDANAPDPVLRAGLAAIEAALGNDDAARTILAGALEAGDPGDWQLAYLAAVSYARLGASDAARTAMNNAIAGGYPAVLLDKDPAFAGISRIEEAQP
jgi:tetratricopeptide (TPR) repeat protein/TolB-like protein